MYVHLVRKEKKKRFSFSFLGVHDHDALVIVCGQSGLRFQKGTRLFLSCQLRPRGNRGRRRERERVVVDLLTGALARGPPDPVVLGVSAPYLVSGAKAKCKDNAQNNARDPVTPQFTLFPVSSPFFSSWSKSMCGTRHFWGPLAQGAKLLPEGPAGQPGGGIQERHLEKLVFFGGLLGMR